MKNFILILFSFMLTASSYAQDTAKVKRTEEYVMIVATARPFSTKVNVVLDYGQEKSFWSANYLKSDDGKLATFNSVVDAMNYMNGLGWEFMNAYPVSSQGNTSVYHYLMRRRIK